MKVQELIDRLANFRCDAEVVFWDHREDGKETSFNISNVARDNEGNVGINWDEDANPAPSVTLSINNE